MSENKEKDVLKKKVDEDWKQRSKKLKRKVITPTWPRRKLILGFLCPVLCSRL